MWKKATLPLLLLLLTALLLAQLVAAESTRAAAGHVEAISTSSSSTERFVETALDINDKEDEDADEATVETYEDEAEDTERGAASRTRHATPQFMKTTPNDEKVGESEEVRESEEASIQMRDNERDEQDDGIAVANDEGSGGNDGSGGEGAAASASAINGDDDDVDGVGVDVGDASEETSEVLSVEQRERDRLASIMMREVTQLIDYALEQQRSVVNQFLQDETIEMVKCATMEAVKQSCIAFMADVREALKLNKGNDFPTQLAQFGVKTLMARDFEMFVQLHNTTRIKQPTAENVIIDNAFRKAGVLQIEVELQKRFVSFTKLFNSTVGEYVEKLLANEQQQQKQQQQQQQLQRSDFDASLVDWYRKYGAATNMSSQVIVLTKFLPLYKDVFHKMKMDAD
ncbi:PREDICTED: uncharacterized protein LOC108967911 [Bactrocera latifrons]|uniref:Protein cappuccino n=1 Tax=Bactrocera latifrons TaxID=174628 RepID=A0A0K8V213_BACLA|nr:PREDICTED: uncharacterized protein LOC108967911 [Bactrocera latifrons]XP_018787140.1 PREDICTED: uncharacterized protein LOC108967911 [Bactrocera latifrons]